MDLETDPFPFALATEALSSQVEGTTLDWLEGNRDWALVDESFYTQYEFDFRDAEQKSDVAAVGSEQTLTNLRETLGRLFRVEFQRRVDITVHRLVRGQRIRIHNDYLESGETHRLVIQLNRGWADGDGGLLMLFGSDNALDLRVVLPPTSRQAVAFAISKDSHHAVSPVRRGDRYSIVYSLYEQSSQES